MSRSVVEMPSAARASKKKAAAAEAADVAPAEAPVAPAEASIKPATKRTASKKPVKVVAVVTPDGIEGSFTSEPRRPLIAHLQIRPSDVLFHDQVLRYDPNPPADIEPAPYDATEVNMFTSGQEEVEQAARKEKVESQTEKLAAAEVAPTTTLQAAATEAKGMPCFKTCELMVHFRGTTKEQKLPETSPVACFWCAHTFLWMPCVIPEREVNGVYNVYGNFCMPECAVAYLLSEGLDPHVRWERMALLHRIYDPKGNGRIFPAPVRECLELFGGPMSIETYRLTASEKRVRVDLHMPPMVSILGSIDTKPIDFFDTSIRLNGGGALQTLPMKSVEEGLRLKRNKPLKERESTLDSVMSIKITNNRR